MEDAAQEIVVTAGHEAHAPDGPYDERRFSVDEDMDVDTEDSIVARPSPSRSMPRRAQLWEHTEDSVVARSSTARSVPWVVQMDCERTVDGDPVSPAPNYQRHHPPDPDPDHRRTDHQRPSRAPSTSSNIEVRCTSPLESLTSATPARAESSMAAPAEAPLHRVRDGPRRPIPQAGHPGARGVTAQHDSSSSSEGFAEEIVVGGGTGDGGSGVTAKRPTYRHIGPHTASASGRGRAADRATEMLSDLDSKPEPRYDAIVVAQTSTAAEIVRRVRGRPPKSTMGPNAASSLADAESVIIVGEGVDRLPGRPRRETVSEDTPTVQDSIVARGFTAAYDDLSAGRAGHGPAKQHRSRHAARPAGTSGKSTHPRASRPTRDPDEDAPMQDAIEVGTSMGVVETHTPAPSRTSEIGKISRAAHKAAARQGSTLFLGSLQDAKYLNKHKRVDTWDKGEGTHLYVPASSSMTELHGLPREETRRGGQKFLDMNGLYVHKAGPDSSNDDPDSRPSIAFTLDENHFTALLGAVPADMAHETQTPLESYAVLQEAHHQAMRGDNVSIDGEYTGPEPAWTSDNSGDITIMLGGRQVFLVPHDPSKGVTDRYRASREPRGLRGRKWTQEEIKEKLDVTSFDSALDTATRPRARPEPVTSTTEAVLPERPRVERDHKGRPLVWVQSG